MTCASETTFANIHVKNMTHVTELELNTRAFAPSFVHIPFIPVGRTKECQECAKIFLQVGSSAVRFKNVPLTTESKISLRSRSCSPAINSVGFDPHRTHVMSKNQDESPFFSKPTKYWKSLPTLGDWVWRKRTTKTRPPIPPLFFSTKSSKK